MELIYDTYLGNTRYVNNWDLVDVSCGPIVGGYLLDRDRSPLHELVRSDLLWERRIAMVSSQTFLTRGETSDLYRLAEILLPDRHDLIHKAVGWSLREAGKKVDRDELRRFLDQHASTMPRTALRYAIEHFDSSERQHYLSLPRAPASAVPGRTLVTDSRAAWYQVTSPWKDPVRSGNDGARRRMPPGCLLVARTARVRNVVEFFIELDRSLGCAILKPRKLLESTRSISATSAMSPAASRIALQILTHDASASRLSMSGAHRGAAARAQASD